MRKLHGVHPKHHKNTEQCQTVSLPIPPLVRIPMSMHIGAACTPLVKPKQHVTKGECIGNTEAFMSAPIHASVSGTVKAISNFTAPNGRVCPMVEIVPDAEQEVCPDLVPPVVTDKASFLDAIRKSGATGMGGASFPTHVKLAPKQKIDTLVINAAECEPYITSDYRTMMENADGVLDGVAQVMKWLEIPKAIIGIEANKPKAIQLLTEKTKNNADVQIFTLPLTYPQGAEKVLIYNTLGRIVKEGELPADEGVIVMNVSTVAFISDYLKTGMPFVERVLTVDGDIVGKPGNYRCPIGTPVEDILAFAECPSDRIGKVLSGGPMMGASLADTAFPVQKATNAILAFEKFPQPKTTPCIHCDRCADVCPLNLMPEAIAKAFKQKDVATLSDLKVNLCMNCGCCTYACPAKRPVAEQNQLAKAFWMQESRK